MSKRGLDNKSSGRLNEKSFRSNSVGYLPSIDFKEKKKSRSNSVGDLPFEDLKGPKEGQLQPKKPFHAWSKSPEGSRPESPEGSRPVSPKISPEVSPKVLSIELESDSDTPALSQSTSKLQSELPIVYSTNVTSQLDKDKLMNFTSTSSTNSTNSSPRKTSENKPQNIDEAIDAIKNTLKFKKWGNEKSPKLTTRVISQNLKEYGFNSIKPDPNLSNSILLQTKLPNSIGKTNTINNLIGFSILTNISNYGVYVQDLLRINDSIKSINKETIPIKGLKYIDEIIEYNSELKDIVEGQQKKIKEEHKYIIDAFNKSTLALINDPRIDSKENFEKFIQNYEKIGRQHDPNFIIDGAVNEAIKSKKEWFRIDDIIKKESPATEKECKEQLYELTNYKGSIKSLNLQNNELDSKIALLEKKLDANENLNVQFINLQADIIKKLAISPDKPLEQNYIKKLKRNDATHDTYLKTKTIFENLIQDFNKTHDNYESTLKILIKNTNDLNDIKESLLPYTSKDVKNHEEDLINNSNKTTWINTLNELILTKQNAINAINNINTINLNNSQDRFSSINEMSNQTNKYNKTKRETIEDFEQAKIIYATLSERINVAIYASLCLTEETCSNFNGDNEDYKKKINNSILTLIDNINVKPDQNTGILLMYNKLLNTSINDLNDLLKNNIIYDSPLLNYVLENAMLIYSANAEKERIAAEEAEQERITAKEAADNAARIAAEEAEEAEKTYIIGEINKLKNNHSILFLDDVNKFELKSTIELSELLIDNVKNKADELNTNINTYKQQPWFIKEEPVIKVKSNLDALLLELNEALEMKTKLDALFLTTEETKTSHIQVTIPSVSLVNRTNDIADTISDFVSNITGAVVDSLSNVKKNLFSNKYLDIIRQCVFSILNTSDENIRKPNLVILATLANIDFNLFEKMLTLDSLKNSLQLNQSEHVNPFINAVVRAKYNNTCTVGEDPTDIYKNISSVIELIDELKKFEINTDADITDNSTSSKKLKDLQDRINATFIGTLISLKPTLVSIRQQISNFNEKITNLIQAYLDRLIDSNSVFYNNGALNTINDIANNINNFNFTLISINEQGTELYNGLSLAKDAFSNLSIESEIINDINTIEKIIQSVRFAIKVEEFIKNEKDSDDSLSIDYPIDKLIDAIKASAAYNNNAILKIDDILNLKKCAWFACMINAEFTLTLTTTAENLLTNFKLPQLQEDHYNPFIIKVLETAFSNENDSVNIVLNIINNYFYKILNCNNTTIELNKFNIRVHSCLQPTINAIKADIETQIRKCNSEEQNRTLMQSDILKTLNASFNHTYTNNEVTNNLTNIHTAYNGSNLPTDLIPMLEAYHLIELAIKKFNPTPPDIIKPICTKFRERYKYLNINRNTTTDITHKPSVLEAPAETLTPTILHVDISLTPQKTQTLETQIDTFESLLDTFNYSNIINITNLTKLFQEFNNQPHFINVITSFVQDIYTARFAQYYKEEETINPQFCKIYTNNELASILDFDMGIDLNLYAVGTINLAHDWYRQLIKTHYKKIIEEICIWCEDMRNHKLTTSRPNTSQPIDITNIDPQILGTGDSPQIINKLPPLWKNETQSTLEGYIKVQGTLYMRSITIQFIFNDGVCINIEPDVITSWLGQRNPDAPVLTNPLKSWEARRTARIKTLVINSPIQNIVTELDTLMLSNTKTKLDILTNITIDSALFFENEEKIIEWTRVTNLSIPAFGTDERVSAKRMIDNFVIKTLINMRNSKKQSQISKITVITEITPIINPIYNLFINLHAPNLSTEALFDVCIKSGLNPKKDALAKDLLKLFRNGKIVVKDTVTSNAQ